MAVQVPESLMDAVTGLSGSGPAFVFPVIEAMADGAVLEGMDRKNALTLAAQAVLGAARMVLETGLHPENSKIWSPLLPGLRFRAFVPLRKQESGLNL